MSIAYYHFVIEEGNATIALIRCVYIHRIRSEQLPLATSCSVHVKMAYKLRLCCFSLRNNLMFASNYLDTE